MRSCSAILSLAFIGGLLKAEPSATQATVMEVTVMEVTAAAKQEALEKMLTERGSPEEFERALAAALAAGVGKQAMLEARFLYQVDRGDDAALAALLPDFLNQRAVFHLDDSAIFSVEEEWLAIVEYVRAIAALVDGDNAGFKKHITEAFWLNPDQAAAFAPHIERVRMRESMAGVVIDFSLKPEPLSGGEPVAITGLMKEKKALLLHFWSPWSRECVDVMPDFIMTACLLVANGVAVVSMVPEGMPDLLEEANRLIGPHDDKPAGAWLIDLKSGSLARQLRVRKLPTMVIVSTEGKILFNGDPSDEKFWKTLQRIDARIIRPASIGNAR